MCVYVFARIRLYFVRVPNETDTTNYLDFEEFLQESYRIFVKPYNTFFRGFSGNFCPNTLLYTVLQLFAKPQFLLQFQLIANWQSIISTLSVKTVYNV